MPEATSAGYLELKRPIAARHDLRCPQKGEILDAPSANLEPPGRDRQFYATVFNELRKKPAQLLALAVAATLYGLGQGATAMAVGLLGRVLLRQDGAALQVSGTHAAFLYCYVGLVATGVKALAAAWLARLEARAGQRVGAAFRQRAAARLMSAGASAGAPRTLATLTVRIRELESAAVLGAFGGIKALAQLLPLTLALIGVSGLPAMCGSMVLLPFAVLLSLLRRRWRKMSERAQRAAEQLHAEVDDLVRYLDLWRSYGAGERVQAALAQASERAGESQARVDSVRVAISGGNEVLGALLLLAALASASLFPGTIDRGALVMAAALMLLAYRPLRDLGDARSWSLRGSIALNALHALLDAEVRQATRAVTPVNSAHASATPFPVQHRTAQARGALPGSQTDAVNAADVALTPAEDACLTQLELGDLELRSFGPLAGDVCDFQLRAGACLCVVGATGSGKTTLLRCLMGLERSQGQLWYQGVPRQELPVGPRSRPFAWVPQDAPVVTASVLENVLLFGGSRAMALAALKFVGAAGLAARCDEVVGPGGTPLSGGECRQLTLARALCSGLPVLLLDEPSAGLDDVATERLVRALRLMRGMRSVVVVTHDQRLLQGADLVLAL